MSCCESKTHHADAGKLQAPKRNHYYFSKMMDVLQFDMEQSYEMQHRMLSNRLAVGTGVLCGLGVEAEDGKVCVNAGVAFDHVGHQVIVPGRYCIDPWHVPGECGKPQEDRARDKPHKVTLCLGYHECLADYAPVMVTDCRNEQACEAGSVVESFKLWIRDGWPDPRADFCEALNDQANGYELLATIDTGGAPNMVAVSGDGKRAILLNESAAPRIQILDLAGHSVIQEFSGQLSAPLGGVSVALDGGHALVTHSKGIVVVDLQSDPPAIVSAFNTQQNYGRCVATHAGARLYAIAEDKVHRIDIVSKTETALALTIKADDLAVSSDNAGLFASDASNKKMVLVDTSSDSQVWEKPLDVAGEALAAGGAGAKTMAWSVASSKIRRFDGSGAAQDFAASLAPVDAAIAGDGHAYVAHKASSTTSEVVVLDGADAKEIARVALDAEATAIAVAPKRTLAVVTHAGAGKVSVVDIIDLRTRLCRMLSGPCPAPDEKPCVVLATLELSADGTIGKLDACRHRTRLLSNELLLELILCLAERQDACCGGDHGKPPEQPPPEPKTLMKVARVEFLGADGQVVMEMPDPGEVLQLPRRARVSAIRFHFTEPVDATTVIAPDISDNDPAKFSLLITGGNSTLPGGIVPGSTAPDGTHAVLFTVNPRIAAFGRGDYKGVLFGDADPDRPAASGTDGRRLDGEPLGLPSGNNSEGGDFTFEFIVR
jgi:DNA-binding beta-propeller fold protein YncE